jgi:hypothetical protein
MFVPKCRPLYTYTCTRTCSSHEHVNFVPCMYLILLNVNMHCCSLCNSLCLYLFLYMFVIPNYYNEIHVDSYIRLATRFTMVYSYIFDINAITDSYSNDSFNIIIKDVYIYTITVKYTTYCLDNG